MTKAQNIEQQDPVEVSVITTSMNYGRFLPTCIESVMNQNINFPRIIHHIVMDGGSTDDTVEVLKKCEAKYPNLYYEINPGESQTEALNHAMKIIEEEFPKTGYIGWLNADDYYIPCWLEASLSALRREKSDVAMTCGGRGLDRGIPPPKKRLKPKKRRVVPYVRIRKLAEGNMVFQPTAFIKMSAFKTLKKKYGYYFDPADKYTQDYDLWCRFIMSGFKIRRIAETVAMLRRHSLQMTQIHNRQQNEAAAQVKQRVRVWLARKKKKD